MSAATEPTPDWPGSVALLLASSTGGVGQHVRSVARGLTAAGATVLVCGPAATQEQFDFTGVGARFQPVEIPAKPTPADARAVAALRRALATTPVDVVHAHGLRAGLVAVLARPAAPVVVTWHNAVLAGGLRGTLSRFVERVVARGARVALGASADLVDRATALGAADARLAPVAAPTLPAPRRRPAAVRAEFGVRAEQPLILSVGRLHPQKRYDVLIDAAARWRTRDPAPVVVIAGSGPAYLALAARISAARAPVTLLGHRTDVADLLAGADLAVVTSDWEARQLFAQEALRAGVPLVATAVGGLPDLVGDAAVLVPPGEVDAVDAAVRELLDDADRRAALGRRGAERAATWPTEADTVATLAALYAELAAHPDDPAAADVDAPRVGTTLMLRRLLPVVLSLMVVVLGVTALAARPQRSAPHRTADFVVIAGVAGLRWEDVDPQTTPTLWRMAEQGSIGSLSVRSAHRPTCPLDGWLTLGAGSFAAWSGDRPAGSCPAQTVAVERPDGNGANLPDQETVVHFNQEQLPWGAVPGSLSESVRCSVAVGPGAAVAAARPFGRVDRYAPVLPDDPTQLLGSCVLSIVDLGTVDGATKAQRVAAARAADRQLARVLAARPPRSLVLVAGVSDTDRPARLHVAVADGPGWEGGWLTSATTGRDGYLQLVDLAPTALAALGRPMPERPFVGRPAVAVDGRPDLADAIAQPLDAEREAANQRGVSGWFYTLLAAALMLLAVAVLPLLRRARRHAGPYGPGPVPRRVVALVELLLIAAALTVPAALLADAVPWWRSGRPGLAFAGVTALLVVAGTAAVRFVPGYRSTLGPLGAVAVLTTLVVGADVVTGSRLQLNGVVGYSAQAGGRYAGLGTVGLGVFLAGALLSAGWLAQHVRKGWRPAVMVAVAGLAVVIVGSPYLGADPVGAIGLTAGLSVAAVISVGGWLTVSRLAWAVVAALAVTVGFAVVDLRRPAVERGSLGRLLAAVGDGSGGLPLHRSSTANFDTLVSSPLTVLALAGALLVWFALMQPWGGLMRLFGIYPAIRAAMAGTAVAAVIGGVLGGVALDVAGAAAALVVPMAALAALRVLDHSTDRTVPDAGPSRAGDAAVAGDDGPGAEGGGGTGSDGPFGGGGPGDAGGTAGGRDAGSGQTGSALTDGPVDPSTAPARPAPSGPEPPTTDRDTGSGRTAEPGQARADRRPAVPSPRPSRSVTAR